MNIRRLTASLLAAVTLLALTACGAPADNTPAQEDQIAAEDQTTTESNEFRVGMECAYAPSNWQESVLMTAARIAAIRMPPIQGLKSTCESTMKTRSWFSVTSVA